MEGRRSIVPDQMFCVWSATANIATWSLDIRPPVFPATVSTLAAEADAPDPVHDLQRQLSAA
jgi:hypothetical protein